MTMAFLRLSVLLLLLTSCTEDNPRPDSRVSLFAGSDANGKTWQITQIEVSFGTVTPNPCVTDNFITYYSNGNYDINEGATKCNPNDPPGVRGTWTLDDAEETMTVAIGDSIQTWTIEETKSESHRITSQFNDGSRTYVLTLSN